MPEFRRADQCKKCACWCENIMKSGDEEVIKVIEEHDIECTQERPIWSEPHCSTPCDLFLDINEED